MPLASVVVRRWFARYEGTPATLSERVILVVLGYAIGGLGYLAVNRILGDGPFRRLELPIDRAIPFVPAFVFGYILVWFTPALAAFFLRDRAELYRTFLAFGLNSLICFPIFLLFPVEYPRVHLLPAGVAGPLLALVQTLDRPVNCFPSHHISTSFTTFLAVFRQDRRWGWLFGAAAALVAISTVFIKQHYIVDIPAGIGVAWLTYHVAFPRRGR